VALARRLLEDVGTDEEAIAREIAAIRRELAGV
jgi:hypothetical protein